MKAGSTPDQTAKPASLKKGDIPQLSQTPPSASKSGVSSVQSKD